MSRGARLAEPARRVQFSEARFPFLVERLGLAVDSGGAGRYGAGWATRNTSGCSSMPTSCRSPTGRSCPAGGARRPGGSAVRREHRSGRPARTRGGALADAEPVATGEIIRIRTTGGGGWGDPLTRPVGEVLRDARWGKVSIDGAAGDYGVVLAGSAPDPTFDVDATRAMRAGMAAEDRRSTVLRPGTRVRPAFRGSPGGRPRLARNSDRSSGRTVRPSREHEASGHGRLPAPGRSAVRSAARRARTAHPGSAGCT
jgi:hypothetical protein